MAPSSPVRSRPQTSAADRTANRAVRPSRGCSRPCRTSAWTPCARESWRPQVDCCSRRPTKSTGAR
eukprot:scaffold3831_cov112-Isochrysis_galbana.AAC.4